MKKLLLLILSLQAMYMLPAQTVIPLYEKAIPGSKPGNVKEQSVTDETGIIHISKVTDPTLTVFLPPKEKATGTAIIICPGGGYSSLSFNYEGTDEAKIFAQWGIAAFVLKYRLPNDEIMQQKEIGPLQDAQRAIQIVRSNAAKWNIKSNQVGIMGFSAGGHLASTAGTHFNHAVIENSNQINLRPDFMILLYPVISFTDSLAHMGSRESLVGKKATKENVALYSNELQITNNTPPTFLVHAKDDGAVKVENSTVFYNTLLKNHVPATIHLYEHGGHGFGMDRNHTSNEKWMDWLKTWLQENKWI